MRSHAEVHVSKGVSAVNWIEDFYTKQEEWSGAYTFEVNDYNRKKASKIQSLAGPPPKSVLELGAGGGQTASATAELGYNVTAIELLERPALFAESLSTKTKGGSMRVIQGDFYSVQLDESFDIVCYWDGFGTGEDIDQVRLLRRIETWLKTDGVVLLDIYSPWYWSKAAGIEMNFDTVKRRYEFIAKDNRMIDRWWSLGKEQESVAQSLRCYSPADLKLLLRDTGLILVEDEIVPGGAVDYEAGTYVESTSLDKCMQYAVKLIKS